MFCCPPTCTFLYVGVTGCLKIIKVGTYITGTNVHWLERKTASNLKIFFKIHSPINSLRQLQYWHFSVEDYNMKMSYPVDATINTEVLSFCYCPLYLSISSKNIVKNHYAAATLKKNLLLWNCSNTVIYNCHDGPTYNIT